MTSKKADVEQVDLTDEPITAGRLIDLAIATKRLPAREGRSLAAWVESLAGESARTFAQHAVDAACGADLATAKHYAWQAETAHLAGVLTPKKPTEV